MALSNDAEIVFLAARAPELLRVNHERNGRTEGRTEGGTDIDDSNRGNQPSVAFPLKMQISKYEVKYIVQVCCK